VERWDVFDRIGEIRAKVPIVLPKNFPSGTLFREWEGVPLASLNEKCVAWDRPGGRWFSQVDFDDRAYPQSEEEFRERISAINKTTMTERK